MEKSKIDFVIQAINNLRPKAAWGLTGTEHSGLDWQDKTQTKPTKEELDAEVARCESDWNSKEYQRLRAPEYPPIADYLDAVVKGDDAQIQAYIDACLAVKAKYPKPQGV